MTSRDDDFEDALGETEAALHKRAELDEEARRAEAAAAPARLGALAAERDRRNDMLQERAEKAIIDGELTAKHLKEEEKVDPEHTVPLERGGGSVDLWFIEWEELGILKDPTPEGRVHPSLSEDRVFEGTTIHVRGVGLDATGQLYELTGAYDIEERYETGLGGAEDERDAKREMFAVPLDASGVRNLLEELMPKRPNQTDWPTFELDSSGGRIFSRTTILPHETDESYQQRLDKALDEWRKKLLRLVKSKWQPEP